MQLSVQIRILHQIHDTDVQQQAEAQTQPNTVDTVPLPAAPTPVIPAPTSWGTPSRNHATPFSPEEVAALLRAHQTRQDQSDWMNDMVDLGQTMQAALQTRSDAKMIEVLQVNHCEIPEAIKTLQRALERELDTEQTVIENAEAHSEGPEPPNSDEFSGSSASTDTLVREFLESGIEALRRMGRGAELLLPSWAITQWEIDLEETETAHFPATCKGTWRGKAVAIRMLAPTIPRKFFIRGAEIWKSLSHPNVLELFGASLTSEEPPWFFVSPHMKHGSLVKYLRNVEPQSQINLLKVIYEVALGMAYLHKRRVLHGDLKVRWCARASAK